MDKNDRLQDEFCLGGVWPSVHQDMAKLTGADQRPPKAIAADARVSEAYLGRGAAERMARHD